jgi:hypothetical protein
VTRIALLVVSSLLLAAAPAHAGSWRAPVDGPLLRSFALGSNPYARGWHRGVDLGAPPGAVVRSACAGRVSFAGRVPGGGRTVSVRCGALVASYLQLGAISVRAGLRVSRGAAVGVVGRSRDPRLRRPHVHLGVRDARSGRYVDPLALLRGVASAAPLQPPLAPAWRRGDPPPFAARPPVRVPIVVRPRVRVPRVVRPRVRVPRGVPRGLPLGAPRGVPRSLPLGVAPRGVAPRGVAPRGGLLRAAFGGGGSPSRGSRSGPLRGTSPYPPARVPYDDDARVDGAPLPPIPWFVWVGLGCVVLALPIGGGFVVWRQRRRIAAWVASVARSSA